MYDINELHLNDSQYFTLRSLLEDLSKDTMIKKILLFGSCARKDNTPSSDLDILIVANKDMSDKEYKQCVRKWRAYHPETDEVKLICDTDIKVED